MSDDVLEQAIERLREQAGRREQGLQEDRRRAERHEDKWGDERLASERDYATVRDVRLGDLNAVLAALAASRSYSDEIVEALVSHLEKCAEAAVNSGSDFNQGVVRGLEIARAQIWLEYAALSKVKDQV